MNPSIPRWIKASIGVALMDTAEDMHLKAIVESVHERTKDFEAAANRAEIRITGPATTEPTKGYYIALVDVNVLLMTRPAHAKNAYAAVTFAGGFAEVMAGPIPVYNMGAEPGDDGQTQYGCLVPRPKRPVSIRDFGQVDPVAKLNQCEISASYMFEWQE